MRKIDDEYEIKKGGKQKFISFLYGSDVSINFFFLKELKRSFIKVKKKFQPNQNWIFVLYQESRTSFFFFFCSAQTEA